MDTWERPIRLERIDEGDETGFFRAVVCPRTCAGPLLEILDTETFESVTELSLVFFNDFPISDAKIMNQVFCMLGKKMPQTRELNIHGHLSTDTNNPSAAAACTIVPQISILALKNFFANAPPSFRSFSSHDVHWTGNDSDFKELAITLQNSCPSLEVFVCVETTDESENTSNTFLYDRSTAWDAVLCALLSNKTLGRLTLRPFETQSMREKTTSAFCRNPPQKFLFRQVLWETSDLKKVITLVEKSTHNLFLHFRPCIPEMSSAMRQWLLVHQQTGRSVLPSCRIPISRSAGDHIPVIFSIPFKLLDSLSIRTTLVLGLLHTSQPAFVGKASCGGQSTDQNCRLNYQPRRDSEKEDSKTTTSSLPSLIWALDRNDLWKFDPETSPDGCWTQFLASLGQLGPTVATKLNTHKAGPPEQSVNYDITPLFSFLRQHPTELVAMKLRSSPEVQTLRAQLAMQILQIEQLQAQVTILQKKLQQQSTS